MNPIEPSLSNEAVRAKTGKDWGEWFAILDAAGAQQMTHKQIVAFLVKEHQVSPWWQQMVTVTYEQARGLRDKHEMPSGYQISRSKTFTVAVEEVYAAWEDRQQRARWLPDPDFTIRKARTLRSLRITWVDGMTNLDVDFYKKGPEKCQVTVQHDRLSNAEQAEQMKAYWGEALNRLNEWLKH
ncbi:MAG TPA: DUF4287 domain-containing protein [Anaerolineales bacterium]|nr:DUF4287 domain-containing protein [Anaerolineales bacterium]